MSGSWGVDPLNVAVQSGAVTVSNLPETQPVSGTVTIQDGGGAITVDGSLTADTFASYGDTLSASGSATAPAANATLATITAPPAGLYLVKTFSKFTLGTPTSAADQFNMEVRFNGVSKAKIITSPSSTLTVPTNECTSYVRCNGTNNLTVSAIANATTGVGYSVLIYATKVAP